MKTFNLKLAYPSFLSLILFLSLFCCNKDELKTETETDLLSKNGKPVKIDICHYSADHDQWILLNIKGSSWADHVLHGDVRLDDQDGDGFVPANECGFGTMGDCDDNDAAVHPGATELCDNGIDDNCNGEVDEGCVECLDICPSIACNLFDEYIVSGACYLNDGFDLIVSINNGSSVLYYRIQSPGESAYDCYIYYENLIQESGMPECDAARLAIQPNEKDIIRIE